MVSRYAVIQGGAVTNIVLWDGDTATWQPPADATVVALTDDQPVGPGDSYDGTTFTPAATTTAPASVAVTVDPQAIGDLISQAQKATTVAATRAVLTALLQQLTPDG
jgi:hypothetical protein